MKQIFIVNPKAGNGRSLEFLKILSELAKDNDDIEVFLTDYKGHATTIALYVSNTFPDSIIYSVGGDGTLNEVVNGINDKTRLSVIPSGSGNDFYKVFKDIKGTKSINLGIVNTKKFINIASIGLDAKVADTANKIKNSRNKFLSYPRAIIKEIAGYKPEELTIDGYRGEKTILTICNGKYYGSGVPINPNYNIDNGYFNFIQVDKLNRMEVIKLFAKIFNGKHLESSKVSSELIKNVTISSPKKLLCNVDGEIISDYNFDFKLIENGITVTNNVPEYVKKAIKTLK